MGTSEAMMLQHDGRSSADSECLLGCAPPKCTICGGKSTGVHYGVISCEGCKAFFKRAVVKNAQFRCYFGESCLITRKGRGWCKSCRLQKCLQAGMSLEGCGNKCSRWKTPGKKALKSARSAFPDVGSEAVASLQNSIVSPGVGIQFTHYGKFGTWGSATNESVHRSPRDPGSEIQNSRWKGTSDSPNSSESSGCFSFDFETKVKPRQRTSMQTLLSLLTSSKLTGNPSTDKVFSGSPRRIDVPDDQHAAPEFMQKYWSVMQERTKCLEQTIRAVTDAVELAYGDQIALWSDFMENTLLNGTFPSYPPKPTVETMIDTVYDKAVDDTIRNAKFASLLPGYDELEPSEKLSRVYDRGIHMFLLHHARYLRNDKAHFLTSGHHLISRYWTEVLFDGDLIKFIFRFAKQLNALQLTLTETYLLLALALLWADEGDAAAGTYIKCLSAHYMDALVHLVESRKAPIMRDLERVIGQFKALTLLQRRYVLALDMTRAPFQPSTGDGFLTVMHTLSGECDDFYAFRLAMQS